MDSMDLDLPPAVVLLEETTVSDHWTRYHFQHVDGRMISVLVAKEDPLAEASNIYSFLKLWADLG